ncbi:hypothetical protein PAMC26510_34930 [Caballeronia sordidicola]|uniref:Uncharacterized protein n=1 Tax=Caballeronia sordidicola TaxID=196367 RepID=A0A242M5U3_CABSO|nr:hypothetical protein PAMC26510_34930 [Caballeronia sordidicola]
MNRNLQIGLAFGIRKPHLISLPNGFKKQAISGCDIHGK